MCYTLSGIVEYMIRRQLRKCHFSKVRLWPNSGWGGGGVKISLPFFDVAPF